MVGHVNPLCRTLAAVFLVLKCPPHASEWQNVSVSILALFCVWTKSLMCKDAVNRDSTFRVMSRLEENSSSLSAVRKMCHLIRMPICLLFHPSRRCVILSGRQTVQHHPFKRRASSVWTLHCIEKFLVQHDPSRRFSSTSGSLSVLERFTHSFQVQEREDQSTVWTMRYPVWTRVHIRKESQFKFDRPDV
jgi:hypothetical protein